MKKLTLLATVATVCIPFATPAATHSQETASVPAKVQLEEGFEWLFDGKSLSGWEGNQDWFRIEEGAIVAGALDKKIPHNEFLCTKEKFGDFELKLEVKLRGQGDNAGVQFRTARIPNNTEVSGYQCDVGRAWNRNVWGCLYDESRRNKMLAEVSDDKLKQWVKPNDWNELSIKAIGNRIELGLNGNPTVSYLEEDAKIAKEGIIGLQIHSGPPTEALYRNIRVKRLDSK
ncbi:3-keto-disaccharide hydrolase [Pirellulaceae bacterium SH467]